MHGNRKNSSRRRIQRSELIDALFFRGDVFEITLLLLEAHVTELQILFELWPDAIAKTRQRQRLDVERERARQQRIATEIFTILFDRDRFVFRDYKLRAILK